MWIRVVLFFLFLFNQIKFRSIYIYINLYICVVFVFNGGERIWSYVGKRFANENKQTSFLKEMGDGFGNKRFDSVFFFGDDNQFLREKNISDEYIIFVSHSEAEKSERTKERERGK